PYPPVGTTYRSQWPAREIEARRSFQFAPDRGVALYGARAADGHVNCSSHDWCVHLAFHSSYGVLSDLDALVLDRLDIVQRLQNEDHPAEAFAPLVLGSFTPEERRVLRNLSDWGVQDMARRFNETRVTTWTLFPESDELDVVLSFKQLFTLLPGYPDGDASSASDASSSEWGAEDHILLRIMAKREGSGATSALLPQVLNFTGSQLFEVDYMSSLEYPTDAGDNLTAAASGMKLDVVLGRRRFGSAIPWDPARPSDLCDACDRQLMQNPRVAHCLRSHVPENVFRRIFEATADTVMPWDDGTWTMEDRGPPADGIFHLNDVVDACFGLRWLRNGLEDDSGSWASSNSGQGEAGTAGSWSSPSSFQNAGSNDGSRWSSPSSSGSADVGAGEWPTIRDLQDALALTREADAGIQCFVASRCPVGDRNFAQAAGRMIVLEHEHAVLRVNMTVPSYAFYLWLALDQTHFSTPVLSSSESPERLAELIANAVPNANDYQLAVDVRYFNNSEDIRLLNGYNDWLTSYYNSGGSASEAADAASSYFADSDAFSAGSDGSMAGLSPNAGQPKTHSWYGTPMDVPELAFTVEISFRNVSVVPEVLDVLAVADESMADEKLANLSWSASASDLRFQLAPLNLSAFQYVPPPADLDLSWNSSEDDDQSGFFNPTNPVWNDTTGNDPNVDPIWAMDSQCAYHFEACDASRSCSLGVRAFLRDALTPSRFYGLEKELQTNSTNSTTSTVESRLGVDLGPTLRQSAAFFTVDSYDLITDLLTCLSVSNAAVNLDVERFVKRSATGEAEAAEPTLLAFSPARVVFEVPLRADGRPKDVVVSYRGQEFTFQWPSDSLELDSGAFTGFVQQIMSLHEPNMGLWTRNPAMDAVSCSKVDEGSEGPVLDVSFGKSFFVDELPRFRAASASEFNEISRSHWAMTVSSLRYSDAYFLDTGSLLTWPRLSNWLYDLALDPSFTSDMIQGQISADSLPICHQCAAQWTACSTDATCAGAMRDQVIPWLWFGLQESTKRPSFDFSEYAVYWQEMMDSAVFKRVMDLFSCLSAAVCPVGVALPADPTAQLVPITLKLVGFFAVPVPLGKAVNVALNANAFTFDATTEESANQLAGWLQNLKPNGTVEVKTTLSDDRIRYDVTCYSTVDVAPTFKLVEDASTLTLEDEALFMTFQLSSNLVARGQALSWDLLTSWFGLDPQNSLFASSVDLFGAFKVCPDCPEIWEALAQCESDVDCLTSTREVLMPLLRNATLPVSTNVLAIDERAVQLDLGSLLLSLGRRAFQSHDGWLAFAHLLRAMANCSCDVAPGQYNSASERSISPTHVQVEEEAVGVTVRLYANTEMELWLDDSSYPYKPTAPDLPLSDVANGFVNWLTTLLKAEPFLVDVDVSSIAIEESVGAVTIALRLLGSYDEGLGARVLVNPRWMPSFPVVTSDATTSLPAGASVTPWSVVFQATGGFPTFDRLLDVLEYGAQAHDTASSSSSSGASEPCVECVDQRQACLDDVECSSALKNNVLPSLQTMTSWQSTAPYSFDASGQFLDGVFANMPTLGARQKMLALLTCSATSKSATSGESCIQKTSALAMPGVSAKLEITQPSSTFTIQAGGSMNVYYQGNAPLLYTADGDTAALSSLLENEVLGGSASSGVVVGVSASPSFEEGMDMWTYSIRYVGFTGLAIPHLHWDESESEDSTMEFVFSASEQELGTVLKPWLTWLDPTLA
ncbi:hypothetical protein BBJ28_00014885, partial [Nothophytophthora sp. Chile5]